MIFILPLLQLVSGQATAPICTGSSTLLSTTDCTKGTPTQYCTYMATATCGSGFYPGFRQVAECVEQPTCYPVPTSTATCTNGFGASTSTLYASGTNNVLSVSCTCDGWASMDFAAGVAPTSYCLPTASCPSFATTSVSINQFCQTATTTPCVVSQTKCGCPSAVGPQYSANSFVGCGSVVTSNAAVSAQRPAFAAAQGTVASVSATTTAPASPSTSLSASSAAHQTSRSTSNGTTPSATVARQTTPSTTSTSTSVGTSSKTAALAAVSNAATTLSSATFFALTLSLLAALVVVV